jgi:putative transposase
MSSQVSLAMQKLLISYTKAINQRFSRAGSIFQGQFRSKRVEKTAHLIQLCVYIHSNPVKAHLTTSPEYWEYSNYQEWIGLRKGSLVNVEFIQDHFRSADEYRKLISEYIQHENMTDEVRSFIQSLES